ncbi:hypothetical protein C0J52_18989 [Blattella germanica]|nr:hypothetical protein C0J52_18989 [Blattella germanica]
MMNLQKRRVFVGNLPPNTTENDIVKKFSKFGCIQSVEIKQRPDSSTFAFLDFEITNKDYNPHTLDELKENIRQQIALISADELQRVFRNFRKRCEVCIRHDSSSDSEEEAKWKLKKFKGTKENFPYSKNEENETANSSKFSSDHKKSVALQKPGNILQRLEAFSDFWKDEEESSKTPRKNKNANKMLNGSPVGNDTTFRNDDSGHKNKKIVFESNDESESDHASEIHEEFDEERTVNDEVEENRIKKSSLFNDSSDDNDEDDDFKIRSQFEGEKGQKLLQLQTKYANDKRFTLDERFYESEDDSTKENADKTESGGDLEEEKKRQLEILENVLGRGIPVSQSKNKNKGTAMLRFDPSKPDHAKFEKQIAPKTKLKAIDSIPDLETDVREKKKEKKEANEDEQTPVSKEKFYVVKDVLTEYLQKKEKGKEMSLLELGTAMLRFDPSKPDHAKFEKQIAPKTKLKAIDSIPDLETDVKEKKKEKKEANEDEQIPVSKEKFYVVKDVLTEYLQKKEKGKEMSLLELYGRKDEGSADEENEEHGAVPLQKGKQIGWDTNPFKYDSSDEEDGGKEQSSMPMDVDVENRASTSSQLNRVNFNESFFFKPNDPRLREGLEFLARGQPTEAAHNFTTHRRELKQLIRFKVKNNLRNHRPFKKKVGGAKANKFRKKF